MGEFKTNRPNELEKETEQVEHSIGIEALIITQSFGCLTIYFKLEPYNLYEIRFLALVTSISDNFNRR